MEAADVRINDVNSREYDMDQAEMNLTGKNKTYAKVRAKRNSLILTMLKIGLTGFGGGSALIPVIEEEVVDNQKIISRDEYSEAVVSACVTPGALPVEIAAGVGNKKAGIKGMLLSAVSMALPGAFLTVLILSAVARSEGTILSVIRYISIGIGGFITSLLLSYAIKTAEEARYDKKNFIFSILVMALVFFLTGGRTLFGLLGIKNADRLIRLSTFQILALSFAVMIIIYFIRYVKDRLTSKEENKKTKVSSAGNIVFRKSVTTIVKETAVWLVFAFLLSIPALLMIGNGPVFAGRGFLSSLMSFGGGDAYLSVADGLFVNTGMIPGDDFYGLLVPAANVLPGSILCKILTGSGYMIGSSHGTAAGIAGALSGFAISVSASGMVFGIVFWIFRTFRNVSFLRMVSSCIRPIISGLLLGVAVTMLKTSASAALSLGKNSVAALILTAAIAAFDMLLSFRKTDNTWLLIGSAAAGGLLIFF